MKKRLLAVVVLLAVLAAAAWLLFGRGDSDKKPATAAGAGTGGERATPSGPRSPREEKPDPRTQELASIHGTVTDKGGGPIAGAQVCAEGWIENVPQELTRDPRCVLTDAQGRYGIDDLYLGTYSVSASAPERIPAKWRGPAPDRDDDFKLKAGERRDGVDLVLATGGVEVTGTVGDINGGPIADAWVEVAPGAWWTRDGGAITRSAADGTFRVWIKPGPIHGSASADGYADGTAQGKAPTSKLEILLTPESVLAGTVVAAETGEPIAGATIQVSPSWQDGDGGWGNSAMSDEEGRWRITRLRPGRYKPNATALGRFGEPAASVLLGLGETVEGVVIPMYEVRVVTGRIVIDDGSGELRGCKKGWVWGSNKGGRDASAASEDDGTVRLEAVVPGTYELSVYCEDHVAEDDYPDLVVAEVDVTDLEWRVHAGGSVVGTVKTRAGVPLAGVDVSARTVGGDPRGNRSYAGERTEDDGSYRLQGLTPGEILVEVSSPDHPSPEEPPRATVVAGQETRLDLLVEDGGAIAGVVVDEDGTPVAGANVNAWGKRWSMRYDPERTGDDGTFSLDGLQADSYRVSASRGWSDQMRKPGSTDDDVQGERVEVAVGKTAQVRLVVESQKGVIAGVVVDAAGAPVPDAYLATERESDVDGAPAGAAARSSRWSWDRKPKVTDVDGAFSIGELSPGKYTVRAYRRGGGEAIAEHVAVGTRTARLVIKATGSVSGTVTIKGGGPPADLSVSVSDEQTGFERSEQFFRTGGKFTLAELPAGHFKVTASAAEGRVQLVVDLAEGEQKTGLSLELEARVTVRGRMVEYTDGKPVPGMMVMISPVGGDDMIVFGGNSDKDKITDADGRFTVEDAPTGKVQVQAYPIDFRESPFSFLRVPRTFPASGGDVDLGEIKVLRTRTKPTEIGGDFGFEIKQYGPEVEDEDQQLEIRLVRPESAAGKGGMKAGDVIIAVDGTDVTGDNRYLAWTLWRVPVGTTVTFGLARGETLTLIAEPPE